MLKIFLIIGAISILISGIKIGAWAEGSRNRVNYHSETKKHRNFRTRIAMISGLIGLLCFGLAGIIYYLS